MTCYKDVRPLSRTTVHFSEEKCSIKTVVRQSATDQKFLKMFGTKMLENFLWKSSATVKL